MKKTKDQKVDTREPQQDRALYKVELILEAAMRLLEKGGLPALTTNVIAHTAGVSIGTLYQYFANKEAILDALAEREIGDLSARLVAALGDPVEMPPEERLTRVIRAVMSTYGGRKQVHRLVMERSLARGSRRLAPVIKQFVGLLAEKGGRTGDGRVVPISPADAFVLTHAFTGVMRAAIMADDDAPPWSEIERGLVQLVIRFADRERR